jgi:hypothetical protein
VGPFTCGRQLFFFVSFQSINEKGHLLQKTLHNLIKNIDTPDVLLRLDTLDDLMQV